MAITDRFEQTYFSTFKIDEAAAVGIPHKIKGQAIYAYVTLNHGEEPSPDVLHWTDSLPKTLSGKIMRRILLKIAAGDTSNFSDTLTLADPGVVEKLLEKKQAITMPS